jgi:SAM-dependent methyltransferase
MDEPAASATVGAVITGDGRQATGWADVATAYAATFAPLCAGTFEPLLSAVRVRAGLRVLDVGAGTGELAVRARALGAEVTAVDPDAGMVDLTFRVLAGGRVRQAGLPHLPFADGAFDAVLANFVVNHVPDPRAGVRELARVTAPGGRVGMTIWPSGQNTQSRLWAAVVAESGAVAPPAVGLPADRDFPRTSQGLARLLAGAGLRDVETRPVRWVHRTEPDALWRGAAAGVGGIGTVVTSQSDELRDAMRAAYDRLVLPLVEDGELVLPTEALLASGTR